MPRVDPIMQDIPYDIIYDDNGRLLAEVFTVQELLWDRIEKQRRRKGK
ncbi:hypothetical protein [Paenibacillus sp. P22]|nr:hypothetical protein [Paenibacillus sp. P22]CDN41675.1 hypothetical protein BN871_AJ_00270 [Paenibacillus sp. P22]